MRRIVPLTIAVVLSMAAAPTALSAWASYGTLEPSTSWDIPSLMWADAPGEATDRIYFNSFPTILGAPNPNVATLASRLEAPTAERHAAILGVWIDCNGDNYVGMAEGALREYDASLLNLAPVNRCPGALGPADEWNGAHNYNGWVTELVPIGGAELDPDFDARQYYDPEAMVWGDFGRPNDATEVSGGGTCALFPAPRGTMQSTGGLLNYLECNALAMTVVQLATADGYRLVGQNVPGPGDPLGIRFDNTTDARGHPFWDHPTLGSEDSQYSAVYVSDCSQDPTNVGETANATAPELGPQLPATVSNRSIHPVPSNPVGDLGSATVPGTVNATNEGIAGDCDTSNDQGGDVYGIVEGENTNTPVEGKRQAEWDFSYWSRIRGLYETYPGDSGAEAFGGQGVVPVESAEWLSPSALIKLPATVALRTSLAEGTANPGPAAAPWFTFYAYVGSSVTGQGFKTPGGSGKYGSTQCGVNGAGIHNGWDCDPANWNVNADGTPITTDHPLAKPGQMYNLRDVDCYDGGTNLGVGLGLPFYGDRNCFS